ncbi:16S rRNA (uracil(1498)-N(3))-methyltransferase [Acidithiobacillus montserratensis]|uniref:16S rRNA (Uracil(1498)-N(3))-methyltransferase n=1 Tax=Acidithiobacillus montserratensis TaxID=2729135 RepID=A0ACD5HIN4_9PROT|nr:16S rRNA (uracil(1498)-N(3))-methyltransferase [Acidithiobacillus montserratensis]MBN2678848.1 16S rRNA (uracil(1498)-N(3))-methyltransferase [Acidithiobacillaceae bacterium]MBU2748029.1 16S rRNA (uracil(1498)-N(3))-methyltransferase [Acidithiobacillus montserratensis]
MPRIHLYADSELPESGTYLLPTDPSHHLLKVFRARMGQELTLFNGDGWVYDGVLTGAVERRAEIEIRRRFQRDTRSPLAIHLWLPLMRGERWDWSLQKAVELGVQTIQPVVCQHAVVQLDEARSEKRIKRWQDMVIAACEQSGATHIPTVAAPMALDDLWAHRRGMGLVLDPAPEHPGFRDLPRPGIELTLLSGPEGGLSAQELAAASARGFQKVCMGPRILRAETAAVAAVAVLQTLWGDA